MTYQDNLASFEISKYTNRDDADCPNQFKGGIRMKKLKTAAAVVLALALPVGAGAMEFQTPGALGMGRAGVARTTDAYATFTNPAGLAFHEKAFSMRLGGDVGVYVTSTLAGNLDKVGKLGLNGSNMTYGSGATTDQVAAATTKAAQFAGVLDDLKVNKGNVALNVDLSLAFQFQSFGLGIFGTSELGAGVGTVDTTNIRAGNSTTATTTVATLATDIGVVAGSSNTRTADYYFSDTQFTNVVNALVAAGATNQQAKDLANTLETKLKANGVNVSGLTPDQIAQGLVTIAPSMGTTAGTIDQNNSSVLLRGIAIAEVPLAYGHKFDLGNYGKLGVGGAAKVMRGTVYSSDVKVMQIKDSKDATTKVKDNHHESTQLGLDLGALWRLEDVKYVGPVNVGLALRNINSPAFEGPVGYDKVKAEPQARLGLGLDPLSWLSLAADLDLTKNKTVLPGRESQIFGGGLEAHFDYWYALYLAIRAGAYKDIAQTGSKPVITAGLSLGPKWLRLDINGAVATATGTYDNKSYPNEAKVEFGLSTAFF